MQAGCYVDWSCAKDSYAEGKNGSSKEDCGPRALLTFPAARAIRSKTLLAGVDEVDEACYKTRAHGVYVHIRRTVPQGYHFE